MIMAQKKRRSDEKWKFFQKRGMGTLSTVEDIAWTFFQRGGRMIILE